MMKSFLMLCLAAALAAGASAAPAETASFISTAAWRSSYASSDAGPSVRSRSASSLLYTDGAGRLTSFAMEEEDGMMTVTIRQDGAVVWRRSYAVRSSDFAVSRRESAGRVYFLITAGEHLLRAEPSADGGWDVRPAEEDGRILPL